MFKRRTTSLLLAIIVLAGTLIACRFTLPQSVPSAETIATYAAATIEALVSDPTPDTHVLPTLEPTSEEPEVTPESSPLSVSFVAPDGNAYYWNEVVGGPTMLTSSGDVVDAYVSPDGMLVALMRSSDYISYSLDVINHDGTGLRTLLTPAAFAALPRPDGSLSSIPYQLVWIPGSHSFAMNTRITFEGPGLASGASVYIINADDGTMTTPITMSDTWYFRFTLSPDGTKFAISLPNGIEIYNLDGSKLDRKVLTYEFVNTASEYAWVAAPVWSADSTTLAAAVPPVEPFGTAVEDSTVWRVAADGLSGELTYSAQMVYFPGMFASISPDLGKIAYLTRFGAPEDNHYTITLANIDGSNVVSYVDGIYPLGGVQWSKDSSRFYYNDSDSGAFIGQPGMSPQALPDFAGVESVQWIDDNRFIGASGPEGGWKLLLGTVGSPTGVIYSTPTTDGSMVFSVNR